MSKPTHTTNDKKSISQKVGKKDLSAEVMKTIEAGDVSMHSRSYFIALSILAFVSVFLTSLLAAIAINLVVRDIDYARRYRFDELGPAARNEFLAAFPWGLVFVTIVAVVATILLARKLEFSYKHRLQTITAFVLGGIIALGVVLSVLNLNSRIETSPPFRPLQTLKERANKKIITGEVVQASEDSIIMQIADGPQIKVLVDKNTYQPHGVVVQAGSTIGVFVGKIIDEETVYAAGIGQPPRHRSNVKGKQTSPPMRIQNR